MEEFQKLQDTYENTKCQAEYTTETKHWGHHPQILEQHTPKRHKPWEWFLDE